MTKKSLDAMLNFVATYDQWHSFSQDVETLKDARILINRHYLRKNKFGQYRVTLMGHSVWVYNGKGRTIYHS